MRLCVCWYQCDQMARLLFQYLAIYNIENLPNSISKLPKNIQNCAKYLMEPFKICQWCFKFCHIGEISSNLVTLVSMSITYFKVMCVRISGERFRVSHR